MPQRSPTLRDSALVEVRITPWLSSQEIASILDSTYGSISSLLYRMVQEGALIRTEGCGPRKGWGYALPGTRLPGADLPEQKKKAAPVQQLVHEVVKEHPWLTVRELAVKMNRNQGSIHSALQRLIKEKKIRAVSDCGLRRGKGYADINEKTLRVRGQRSERPTLWDHLLED